MGFLRSFFSTPVATGIGKTFFCGASEKSNHAFGADRCSAKAIAETQMENPGCGAAGTSISNAGLDQ
jgi:hypothetical protein